MGTGEASVSKKNPENAPYISCTLGCDRNIDENSKTVKKDRERKRKKATKQNGKYHSK